MKGESKMPAQLEGILIMAGVLITAALLLFGVPALFHWLNSAIFNARKKSFEAKNPNYVLTKLFGTTIPLKRECFQVQALDSPEHYVLVYPSKLSFNIPGENRRLEVNTAKLLVSLKAWKSWNPTKNGLGVEVAVNAGVPTFKLSLDDTKYPSLNCYFMEVRQDKFLEALEKASRL